MNDPQLFRRRRFARIAEEEDRRTAADCEAATAAAVALRAEDDAVVMRMIRDGAPEELVFEECRTRGMVELIPGVWAWPPPDDAA